jgi:hypothetical protein
VKFILVELKNNKTRKKSEENVSIMDILNVQRCKRTIISYDLFTYLYKLKKLFFNTYKNLQVPIKVRHQRSSKMGRLMISMDFIEIA